MLLSEIKDEIGLQLTPTCHTIRRRQFKLTSSYKDEYRILCLGRGYSSWITQGPSMPTKPPTEAMVRPR